jgi:hypothetical protein
MFKILCNCLAESKTGINDHIINAASLQASVLSIKYSSTSLVNVFILRDAPAYSAGYLSYAYRQMEVF